MARARAVSSAESRGARRLAEATTSPIFNRHLAPAERADLVVGDVRIPRSGDARLTIDGRSIASSNLDKVLYPETLFTKAESIAYWLAVAPALLPHLADRALTVGRFPGGVDGRGFAQAEVPGRPSWIRTAPITLAKGGTRDFTLVDERAALVWLAQMGTIEIHTFPGRASALESPTSVMFDLDPTPPAGLLDAAEVALRLRDVLVGMGLVAFAKTSGSVGVHVVVPLKGEVTALATHAQTRALAQHVAKLLAGAHPDRVSDRMERSARVGKVLVDARQNAMRLTTVVPYSLRSTPRPSVSTPLAWEELDAAVTRSDPSALVFGPDDVLQRIARVGDLHAGVLEP
jgi:bifunctional non-homologous end joining protein LigD